MAFALPNGFAQIFESKIDEQLRVGLTSNWMEGNANLVIYQGGRTIQIPKLTLDGLGNYNPTNGFTGLDGTATLNYEPFTLQWDRAREFNLPDIYVDETNFALSVGNVFSTFQRVNVIPEIDSLRYSYIATKLLNSGDVTRFAQATAPTASTIFQLLNTDISKVSEYVGIGADLVITISNTTYATMQTAGLAILRAIKDIDGLEVEYMTYNGFEIKVVPDARMYTAFDVQSGAGTQAGGGVIPATGAKAIYWLITWRDAPIAIRKLDQLSIFDPNINQSARSWKLQYRLYSGAILPDNKIQGCFVRTSA